MSEESDKKIAENKANQGKSAVTKKKIRRYNKDEINSEIARLEKGNHQNSDYYKQLKALQG